MCFGLRYIYIYIYHQNNQVLLAPVNMDGINMLAITLVFKIENKVIF